MGLNRAGLNRFRAKVDETLAELFPAELLIEGKKINGSGPGGRAVTEYIAGGESPNFRFPFRVARAVLAKKPDVGDAMEWHLEDQTVICLEVIESPYRPHESHWSFTCRHRRR